MNLIEPLFDRLLDLFPDSPNEKLEQCLFPKDGGSVDASRIPELLQAGAEPNRVVSLNNKLTLIHQLVEKPTFDSGSAEALQMLANAGGDLEARMIEGETPLIWACGFGTPEAVRALVAAGADVNAAGTHGMHPLERAVQLDDLEMVECLLAAGASPRRFPDALERALAGCSTEVKAAILRAEPGLDGSSGERRKEILAPGRNFYLLVPSNEDFETARTCFAECLSYFRGGEGNLEGGALLELAVLAPDTPVIAISAVWPDQEGPGLPPRTLQGCDIFVDGKSTTVRGREYIERLSRVIETARIQ